MNWINQGVIFRPNSIFPWMKSHAQLPTPVLDGTKLSIYFASRDQFNRSHVGAIDGHPKKGFENFKLREKPILIPGPYGGFDDHGVYPSSIVKMGDEWWMYYIGWNPSSSSPIFYSSIGLAISKDRGQSFEKVQNYPVMGRNEIDPLLVTSPFVLNDSGMWRMWYVSGLKWKKVNNDWKSWYHIKYAESEDGINWKREGHVAIDFIKGESNIARPWVVKKGKQYHMWYCKCSDSSYNFGYAESTDGMNWIRKDDQFEIPKLACGFDSESQAYPSLFEYEGHMHLLYNGNQYGKAGFALATMAL